MMIKKYEINVVLLATQYSVFERIQGKLYSFLSKVTSKLYPLSDERFSADAGMS